VVCLSNVFDIHRACNGNILKNLRSAIHQPAAFTRNVIIIATDLGYPSRIYSDTTILSAIGMKSIQKAISVVPVNSPTQRMLVKRDVELETSTRFRSSNIKALQKSIINISKEAAACSTLLQPLARWDFLTNSEMDKIIGKDVMQPKEIDEIVRQIEDDFSSENIERVILQIGRSQALLQTWTTSSRDRLDQNSSVNDKWSNFSPETQEVIRHIEREIGEDKEEFKFVGRFLSLLIDPKELEEGWSDIALDPEVEEAVKQIIPQTNSISNSRPAYGVLKRNRIGGALLYGPPGTGKTYLARVLARESKAVTLCASGAELENMHVGETEKAIKGLFRLGSMLTPSIIFIDEADALFRARGPDERGHERSRTNQLLAAMDGLASSKKAPFVLLASNFPGDLDHAVLRRVPSRFHIGLPTTALRERLLKITLRDEILASDVDLARLAEMTYRYSGSDIQALCVQTALVCDSLSTEGQDIGRRVLGRSHFEKAFRRVSPTVSGMALAMIQDFAREFDPVGYDNILTFKQQEREIQAKRDVGLLA
jgi:SpoVK/Ycf46/Vps4 family AAA+-type ATPase